MSVTPENAAPELSKAYDHAEVEPRWYRVWMERGYFHADEKDRTRPARVMRGLRTSRGSL